MSLVQLFGQVLELEIRMIWYKRATPNMLPINFPHISG